MFAKYIFILSLILSALQYLYKINKNMSSPSMNLFSNNNQKRVPQTAPLFPPHNPSAQTNDQQTRTSPNQQAQSDQMRKPSQSTSPQIKNQSNVSVSQKLMIQQTLPNDGATQKKRRLNFKQIFKLIQTNSQQLKILQKNPQIRKAFSLSLQYFDRTAEKTQLYEQQHSKKQNFGFSVSQMGEQCRNFKSQKIDQFWKVLVQFVSEICNVSQLIVSQYLRFYIVQEQLYLKILTIKQFYCGSIIRTPNANFLQNLYRNNYETRERTISLQSQFFLQIFEYLLNEIYSQYLAMLKIIQYLQTNFKKYFRQTIKKQSCDYFTVLWKKYKFFSETGFKQQTIGDDARAKKIRQFYTTTKKYQIQKKIRKLKISVAIQIGVSLVQGLDEYGSWRKEPTINTLIDYKEAINFIDNDLNLLVSEKAETPQKEEKYVKINLSLLLKIIPLCSLAPKQEIRPTFMQSRNNRQIQTLRTLISSTKSQYLQSFRFLFWYAGSSRNSRQIDQRWQKVPKVVEWTMRSGQWSQWIGLLLSKCDNVEDIAQSQLLLFQIVKMLKIIVDNNVDQFWSDNPSYEFQLIINFLINYGRDKGVKDFLPVFTKCLGNQANKLEHAQKTLDIIGFEGITRQIRDNLMINLDISDKHNSSVRLSMFYSHQNKSTGSFIQSPEASQRKPMSDNYPQQQIKFLCKLIQNCKQDLSRIQSVLFECQIEDSTGILTCKFLFQCLSKLRQSTASCLKCMRYIIQTINILFLYPLTRSALMIAMSLSFSQQLGQNNKNQLYDMISFVCHKPSSPQQHKQSQKLKMTISYHLCSIMRTSKYISEYFPMREDLIEEEGFLKLNHYITNKNYPALFDWYRLNYQHIQYKATPWLSSLLLILQSQELLPFDFQTLRLLVYKLQIDKEWIQQYQCLKSIVQILNNAKLTELIFSILQPNINSAKDPNTHKRIFLFGLINLKFQQNVLFYSNGKLIEGAYKTSYKQNQSIYKAKAKQISKFKLNKQIIVGNIAGSLQLIASLLSFNYIIQNNPESYSLNTELLRSLKIYSDMRLYFTEKSSIYHYKVTLNQKTNTSHQLIHNSLFQPIIQTPPPTVSINILQVLASYINLQTRYNIPNKQHLNKKQQRQLTITEDIKLQQNQQIIDDLKITNVLDINQNQLTMKTDYTIGIGVIFRIFNQIILHKNCSIMFYHCLVYHDYSSLCQIGKNGDQDTGEVLEMVREVSRILERTELPEQIQIVFQFLTLAINQCSHFMQLILQSGILSKLRRSIQIILDSCENQKRVNILNKISLFSLALAQYHITYSEQVQHFVKLPTNIIHEIVGGLSGLQSYLQKCYRQRQPHKQGLIISHLEYFKKIGFQILFKGTVHVCIELVKRFYLVELNSQNAQIFKSLIKMAANFLQIPSKPQTDYLHIFKLKAKNMLLIDPKLDISLIQYLSNLKNKQKFSLLNNFIGFFPSICEQYGRNYQFYGMEVFAKSIYSKYKNNTQAQSMVLNVFKVNYQASLEACHQMMMTAFLSLILVVETTGEFGHVLCFADQDQILSQNYKPMNHFSIYNNQRYSSTGISKFIDLFKFRNSQSLQGNFLSTITPQQCFQYRISLVLTLINYFQNQHSKHYNNDIILFSISEVLKNMSKSGILPNKLKGLIKFVFDSTRISFKASPRVFTLFLITIIDCWCLTISEGLGQIQIIQQICQIFQTIVIYGGNYYNIQAQNSNLRILQSIYSQKGIQQNLFLIVSALSKILTKFEPIYTYHSNILTIVTRLTNFILDKYLVNYQQPDLTNINIIKLVNILIIDGYSAERSLRIDQNKYDRQWENHRVNSIGDICNKYVKFLIKGLERGSRDEIFNCFIFQGLAVVMDYSGITDIAVFTYIMEFLTSQFNSVRIQSNLQNANQSQNYLKQIQQKTYLKTKQRISPKRQLSIKQTSYLSSFLTHPPLLTLPNLLQITNFLCFLSSVVSQELLWTNQKYSYVPQSIFNALINQQVIYQIMQSCGLGKNKTTTKNKINSRRVLYCRVQVSGFGQNIWEKIEVSEVQNFQTFMPEDRIKVQMRKQSEGKRINLLEFIIHVQTIQFIRYFAETLSECLSKSQSLRKFYNKMLKNRLNFVDELVWDKIQNSLISCVQYLKQLAIPLIRFYPKSLQKLIPLHSYICKNTDMGYFSNFMTSCFSNLGINPCLQQNSMPSNLYTQKFKYYLMNAVISLYNSCIGFVEIWKSTDWKSNINWESARNSFINQIYVFYQDCTKYVIDQDYYEQEKQNIESIQNWLERNQTMHFK